MMRKLWIPALALMTLWAAMALADDSLEIGKSYVVRDNTKGALSYQFTKVPLEKGESITIVEQIGDDHVVQRESGERVKIRTFILQAALRQPHY